jgi:hypothetical protein
VFVLFMPVGVEGSSVFDLDGPVSTVGFPPATAEWTRWLGVRFGGGAILG